MHCRHYTYTRLALFEILMIYSLLFFLNIKTKYMKNNSGYIMIKILFYFIFWYLINRELWFMFITLIFIDFSCFFFYYFCHWFIKDGDWKSSKIFFEAVKNRFKVNALNPVAFSILPLFYLLSSSFIYFYMYTYIYMHVCLYSLPFSLMLLICLAIWSHFSFYHFDKFFTLKWTLKVYGRLLAWYYYLVD